MKNICLMCFLGLSLVLFSCEDPYDDSTYAAYEELPISALLASQPDQFSMWVELMHHAEMYNTMNLQTTYTFFVPTNEAVSRYLENNGYANVTDIPKSDAEYLIKYHTIHRAALSQSQFVNGVINDPNATDDNLSIEFREGGLNAIYINGEARVVELDIQATNGVIHALEEVLVPVTATILDKLKEDRFSIFLEAVEATGFAQELNTIYEETTDVDGNLLELRVRMTAFAVPNEVYAQEGIQSLEDLKEKLEVSSEDYRDSKNELNKYVAYHLLDQLRSFDDLGQFPEGENTRNMNTLAPNELLSVSDISGSLTINYDEESGEGVGFIRENINCKNGVVHEVDHWMPLFVPKRVTVLWDLTDYADLEAICSQFQNGNLGSTYNRTITQDEVDCYVWKSVPEYKTNVVTYRNNRGADGIWYADALNYDHLRLELGPSGWLEMESPVLIKGKYRITMVYLSYTTSANTGYLQCSIDGNRLGSQWPVSNFRHDRKLERQLTSGYTFDETSSHTLRIVAVDGNLLTLDHIKFEPVD